MIMLKEMFLVRDREYKKKIFNCWLISILTILFISKLGELVFDSYIYKLDKLFDIEHYLNIAKYGYRKQYEFAFFPLIPCFMHLLNFFNIPILGMVILNNIFCLLSTHLIFNILNNIYNLDKDKSIISCKMWLFSPIRIFTFVPYTESLFILLSLMSFYLYKKRKFPLLLGICLGLAVQTRSIGCVAFFVLFGFLFIDFIKEKNDEIKKQKFKYIISTYIPSTIISCLYPIYLQYKVGNWKYFIDVQYECWNRNKGNIFSILIFDINRLIETTDFFVAVTIIFTFTSLFVSIMLIILTFYKSKFEKLDLILILLISIFIIFSTYRLNDYDAGTSSFFRYIYGLIPMYLLSNNKLLLVLNIIIFIATTFLFLGNIFIA